MRNEDNTVNDATGARQLDFEGVLPHRTSGDSARKAPYARPRNRRPVSLCVVCGRSRARLTLARNPGQAPVRLCLRCHHSVLQQRKMVHAGLAPTRGDLASTGQVRGPGAGTNGERKHRVAGDAGLIVPREARLSADERYAALTLHRRRAQVAARRALESELGSERERPVQGPNLLDLAC
jgi:hypothetical protein